MPLKIEQFVLGPIQNNSFLIIDQNHGIAAVVDPPFGAEAINEYLRSHQLTLQMILITHAHFDHIGGINTLIPPPPHSMELYLHPDDLLLWQMDGGAEQFGFSFDKVTMQPKSIIDNEEIRFGGTKIKVLHTPGHTPGHVVYYLPQERTAFCGDLIFYHGVGRTDLPGSSSRNLIRSIESKIFTLPNDVILHPGHGPSTTVQEEKMNNPFLI